MVTKSNSKKDKAFAYLRVSTAKQVEEGESLEAQRAVIEKYAASNSIEIVKEFRDEGASGKNIVSRRQFAEMMDEVAAGADIQYVLVYKLSRFGRNASDALNSAEIIKNNGSVLVCVEEGFRSDQKMGEMALAVMSTFAQMERENIITQTMAGRKQKASMGMWNGAQAPYGYTIKKVENGSILEVNESEAEIVRIIYRLYTEESKGPGAIAAWLNTNGYTKQPRGNMKKSTFSTGFVLKVIDNPVYNGKIAFGRRRTELIKGGHNETKVVKSDDYEVFEGQHDAIIDDDTWNAAREKRALRSRPFSKPKKGHANLLTGMLVCPCCGRKMVANATQGKIKKDGTRGKATQSYACKYSRKQYGGDCTFTRQYNQNVIDPLVVETVKAASRSKVFEDKIRGSVDRETEEGALREGVERIKKTLTNNQSAIRKVTDQMDHLDSGDETYEFMYEDLQRRYESLCKERPAIERALEKAEAKLTSAIQGRLATDHIYQLLDEFADSFDDIPPEEQKERIETIVERVELNPDPDYDAGETEVSNIVFKVPVTFNVYSADSDMVKINVGKWTPHGNEMESTRQLQNVLTRVFKSDEGRVNDDTVENVTILKRRR